MLNNPLVQDGLLNIVQEEENLDIIQCLIDGIDSDEKIAEETGIKLNIVRKILYKLYDSGVASYKRSKDPETQWYAYSWKFEEQEVSKLIKKDAEERVKELKKLVEEEENSMFFICPYNHCRLNFEQATYYGFQCPECGAEISFHDNKDFIEQLNGEKETWEEILKDLSE